MWSLRSPRKGFRVAGSVAVGLLSVAAFVAVPHGKAETLGADVVTVVVGDSDRGRSPWRSLVVQVGATTTSEKLGFRRIRPLHSGPLSFLRDDVPSSDAGFKVHQLGPGVVAALFDAAAPLSIHSGAHHGGSDGLATALALIDNSEPGSDLAGGKTVAATGSVLWATSELAVAGVGSVAEKTRAAVDAAVDVLFVAVVDVDAATSSSADGVEVVGVDSVYEAVRWLCSRGGTSSLCIE